MRTVAVCSHDDDGENELQRSQDVIECLVLSRVHDHYVEQTVIEFGRM